MKEVNEHKFDFKLPMFPNQKVSDNGMPCELTMDGRKLEGVTSLFLKAGANGFTNVAIEFEASCAVQFVGHLDATVVTHDGLDGELFMSAIVDDAIEHVYSDGGLEPGELFTSYEHKAEFLRKAIALALERMPSR